MFFRESLSEAGLFVHPYQIITLIYADSEARAVFQVNQGWLEYGVMLHVVVRAAVFCV